MFEHDTTNQQVAAEKSVGSMGEFFKRLLSKVTGPMPITGGQPLPSREGLPGRPLAGVDVDQELLEKTRHLRHKNETMMEFFARTFIGAHTIRTSSKAELDRMYQVVVSNPDYQENRKVEVMFEQKTPRTRFVITD